MSHSCLASSNDIAKYVNDSVDSDEKSKIGIIAFGAGEPYVLKKLQTNPKISIIEILDLYDNPRIDDEGFIMTSGTDIASAIAFSATQFTNYSNSSLEKPLSNCRLIILTDGIETDGNAATAASEVASMGLTIDVVYFAPRDYTDENEVQIENVEISNFSPTKNQPFEINIVVKSHKYGDGVTATFNIFDLDSSSPNQPIATFTEDINSAEQTITTTVQLSTGGLHTIKVEMLSSIEQFLGDFRTDSLKENNVFYTYVLVQETDNIQNSSDIVVELNKKNFTTSIIVKSIDLEGNFPNGDRETSFIESYYHSPSEKIDPTNFNKPNGSAMSPEEYINYLCPFDSPDYKFDTMEFKSGTFISEFKTPEPGLYTVAFLRLNSNYEILDAVPPYTFVTFSYSDEYDTFFDTELARSTLAAICQQSGGSLFVYEN